METKEDKILELTYSIRTIVDVLYDDLANSECEAINLLSNQTKGGLFASLKHLTDKIDIEMEGLEDNSVVLAINKTDKAVAH